MEKVFLWAGVRAYVDKGKIVNVVEEEYMGEKHFESISLEGTVLKMKTKTGIEAEYDFKRKQFLKIKPFSLPLSLGEALQLADLFSAVATMQAGLDTIGKVTARILAMNPLDVPLITADDLDRAGLDIENPPLEEITKRFDRLVNVAWHPDCDPGIEIVVDNRSGARREVEVQFEVPDGVLIGHRKDYKWGLLADKQFKLHLEDGQHSKLTFVALTLRRVHGVARVRVVSEGEVIAEREFSIFSC